MADPADPVMLTSLHARKAADGDRSSIEWLVGRFQPLLLAQADWRLGPVLRRTCDPCDLVHEAWLVLLPRLQELPARDGRLTPVLLRFLSTTILGKVRNLLRREVRRGTSGNVDLGDEGSEIVGGPRSEVVSAVVRRERGCQVREALDALADTDREIVLLRGIEQLDAGLVADRLAISREAVSKRYRRALARLCEQLPDSVFEELSGVPGSEPE